MARLLWTPKQHIGPLPRAAHVATFDTRRSHMLLFGGQSLQGAVFGDTWEWDGENWTQLNDLGPSARFLAAMTYDSHRNSAVLFGGNDGTQDLGDTWEWNGEDWTQMSDSGPAARSGHAMVFDAARERVVLFGGVAGNTFLSDSWEWQGDEWVQVEDIGPSARRSHAMAFDAARGRSILFGGLTGTGAAGDTWEFDGVSWTQRSSFGPPACFGASMIHDGQRALLYGGVSALTGTPVAFHFSWQWDGQHWTARQDLGPGDRWNHSMVYDAKRKRGVLFGGTASLPTAASLVASGETWEQFEQGAGAGPGDAPPPPPGDIGIASLVVPVQPVDEGQAVSLEVNLSAPSATPTQVQITLERDGNLLLDAPFEVPAATPQWVINFVLPAGNYTASASLGASQTSTSFEVQTGAIQLAQLDANPASVPAGSSFTLTAILNGPAPSTILVPMVASVGGPDTLWPGPFVQIMQGAAGGKVDVDTQNFPQITLTLTGSLGGDTSTTTVTIT